MTVPAWLSRPLGWLLAALAALAGLFAWRWLRDRRVIAADRRARDIEAQDAEAKAILDRMDAEAADDATRREAEAARQAEADAEINDLTQPVKSEVTPEAATEAEAVTDILIRRSRDGVE